MRLWHKSLIHYLPRQQLISQWRECCCIAKNIKEKGTPNHVLVNPIMNYPIEHFIAYTYLVAIEMTSRGYDCNRSKFAQHFKQGWDKYVILFSDIFKEWHNDRYLKQCLYNLQEKADRGAIPKEEWIKIENHFTQGEF